MVKSRTSRLNQWAINASSIFLGVQMMAAVYYYVVAAFLIMSATVQQTTPLFNLSWGIRDLLPFWANHYVIGVIVLIASICTTLSIYSRLKWPTGWHLGLLAPQLLGLLLTIAGEIQMIGRGAYADGTERPSIFIAADQSLVIVLGIFFWLSVLHMVWVRYTTYQRQPTSAA